MVFFWLMIHKKDLLTLALGLELWGAFPFANWSPGGETDASGHAPHPGSQGHSFLPCRPGSPGTAVPTVGVTLKAEPHRNPGVASDFYVQPASLEEVTVMCKACTWSPYPEPETTWPAVGTHSVSPALL